jgi:hypothetical protein
VLAHFSSSKVKTNGCSKKSGLLSSKPSCANCNAFGLSKGRKADEEADGDTEEASLSEVEEEYDGGLGASN